MSTENPTVDRNSGIPGPWVPVNEEKKKDVSVPLEGPLNDDGLHEPDDDNDVIDPREKKKERTMAPVVPCPGVPSKIEDPFPIVEKKLPLSMSYQPSYESHGWSQLHASSISHRPKDPVKDDGKKKEGEEEKEGVLKKRKVSVRNHQRHK
ncbi:hypothetical protein HMI54_003977 [Coelomomyces lativittatus]|nr:hypothetical protein HMI56_004236 [Coelomomyces lativittatus]KAJ1507615.1 hypothetical protein HMI54_003977 [Coelomomyces lativittatus]